MKKLIALLFAAALLPAASYGDLFITEIMYNPASAEDDWEWVEVYNSGEVAIDMNGYVIDDGNNSFHESGNIGPGVVQPGQYAVLFNADDLTSTDFLAAWIGQANLIPVTNWSAMALNNGGDSVGLWSSFSDYSSDIGEGISFSNAIDLVDYDDSGDWPADNGSDSISYTGVTTGDNNVGTNWVLTTLEDAEAVLSLVAGGNVGNETGSPGFGPFAAIPEPAFYASMLGALALLLVVRRRQ